MKKLLSLALALVLVFALVACGGGAAADPTPPPTAAPPSAAPPSAPANTPSAPSQPTTPDAPPAASGPSVPNGNKGGVLMDEIAFYDPDFDYFSQTRYKVQYMSTATGVLYEISDLIFDNWSKLMNLEYGRMWSSGGDNELFLNNISTFASQGVDGLLINPDSTLWDRIAEVCDENSIHWVACDSPPRNSASAAAELLHPYTGFDNFQLGQFQAEKLFEYYNDEWSNIPLDDIGFVCIDYSVASAIHERVIGEKEIFLANGGKEENFFVADCVTGAFDIDTAYQKVNSLISTEGGYTHWLIAGNNDDSAQGASAAIDNLGLLDNTLIVSVGGPGLYAQWDMGLNDQSWRFVLACGQQLYGENTIGSLYAFMSGFATPDTIWPMWNDVNDHGIDGHSYGKFIIPVFWAAFDNYQTYLEWSDAYGNVDVYHYPITTEITRDMFPSRAPVPDYYSVKQ